MYVSNPLASFARPATTPTYASGQLVANSATAGSVTPLQWTLGNAFGVAMFRLTRVRLYKSGTTGTNGSFRVHLYQGVAAPTVTNGDTGNWLSTGAANWLGNIDVTSLLTFSDGCAGTGSAAAGSELYIKASAGANIYGLIEARAGYVGQSAETFTVVLEELDSY